MLGYLDNGVRRDPSRNAKHQCVDVLAGESSKRLTDLFFLGVVGDRISLYKLQSFALKRRSGC